MSSGGPAKSRRKTRPRIRRAAVVVNPERPHLARPLSAIGGVLRRGGIEVTLYHAPSLATGAFRRLRPAPELVVSLGGDGTILAAARALAGSSVPLLAINRGGLGFLASAEQGEARTALGAALEGRCTIETHRLLEVVHHAVRGRARRIGLAVNDAVLRSADAVRALRAELSLEGQDIGLLLADGLVVATVAGSTAYSLSAGGPLLLGDLAAVVATPVCPHTLGSRSVVLSDKCRLEARVAPRGRGGAVSLDGLPAIEIPAGDTVSFRLTTTRVRFLRLAGRGPARALRDKLNWHGTSVLRSP